MQKPKIREHVLLGVIVGVILGLISFYLSYGSSYCQISEIVSSAPLAVGGAVGVRGVIPHIFYYIVLCLATYCCYLKNKKYLIVILFLHLLISYQLDLSF
jgi:hypothetical protein